MWGGGGSVRSINNEARRMDGRGNRRYSVSPISSNSHPRGTLHMTRIPRARQPNWGRDKDSEYTSRRRLRSIHCVTSRDVRPPLASVMPPHSAIAGVCSAVRACLNPRSLRAAPLSPTEEKISRRLCIVPGRRFRVCVSYYYTVCRIQRFSDFGFSPRFTTV